MVHVTQPAKRHSVKHLAAWWLAPEGRVICIWVVLIRAKDSRKSCLRRKIGAIELILGPFLQELEACALSNGLAPAGFFLNGPFLGDSESGAAHVRAFLNEYFQGGVCDNFLI